MRRHSGPPRSYAILIGAVCVLAPSRASAFDNQWHAGVKGGLAFLDDRNVGPAAGLHGAYGLSDMFDAELEVTASRSTGDPGPATEILSASAGLAYKVDILRWIPYVGVLGGYYYFGGAPGPNGESGSTPGMSFQVGLDYLLSRDIALSLDFRPHFSFKDEFYSPLRTLMLGAEFRFGY